MARIGRAHPARAIILKGPPPVPQTHSLAASVVGAGSVTGQATLNPLALQASVTGTSSVTAAPKLTPLSLQATVTGTGSVTADLIVTKPLDADVDGTGSVAAALTFNPLGLAASVAGISSVTAAPTLNPLALDSNEVAGVGSVTATLHLEPLALQAAVAGTSTVAAAPRLTPLALQASVQGVSTVTANLVVFRMLQADVAGAAAVTAAPKLTPLSLKASVAGTGTVAADAKLTLRLQADFAGVGVTTAAARLNVAVAASVVGTGSLAADLTVTGGGPVVVNMQAAVTATSAVDAFLGGLLGTRIQMPNRYQEWGQAVREDSGKTHTATVISAGGTANVTLDCDGYDVVTFLARMTGSADADLALSVRAFEDDETTLFDMPLTAVEGVGPTHASGVVRRIAVYNIRGIGAIEVRVVNNNAGQQTANVIYNLRSG